jgi:hypothetical protein
LIWGKYGFKDAFNLTNFWVATDYLGIDQGPIVIMIENYLNGSVWDRFMQNPDLQVGLERAGFSRVSPVGDEAHGAVSFIELGQNTPNPFMGSTVISYRVAQPGPVVLRVYDLRGHLVRQINHQASDTNIQMITMDAKNLASGIYSYSLEAGGHQEWKRCIIIK